MAKVQKEHPYENDTTRLLATICCLALYPICVSAQVQMENDPFAPYTGCKLPDELSVVETAPLGPGISSRTFQFILGSYTVNIVAGRRVMFAYPDEDFYANVKVEILPEDGYAKSRSALIGNFQYVLASGDDSRNYKLKPELNGFEIQGLDRAKREGGVLGVYLFFDDPTRTVTTIYFRNQEPPKRFKTMEEYAIVRDHFLNNYTSCVRQGLRAGTRKK